MSTRQAQAAALTHVLDEVLALGPIHPLWSFLASESVDSIFTVTRYKESQIADKELMDSNGITRTLTTATVNQLWFQSCETPSAAAFIAVTTDLPCAQRNAAISEKRQSWKL